MYREEAADEATDGEDRREKSGELERAENTVDELDTLGLGREVRSELAL